MKRWDRLLALIPQKTKVLADVGTDHGYLAINAIKKNQVETVYATDIAQEPLNQAAINIKLAHLDKSQKIHLLQSNGLEFLKFIPEPKIDYLIIAGLGTKTIHQIILEPNAKIDNYLLLSNTEISKLRQWTQLHNFQIKYEDFFYHHQRPYWLILIDPKHQAKQLDNLDFGDWKYWYQNNLDYRDYLLSLKNRYLGYNEKITNSAALIKNKNYIKKIENYLKQWN